MDATVNKYLYCVIKGKEPKTFAIQGMDGKGVYTVGNKGLMMVVSDTSEDAYYLIREHLLTHQRVIEQVMREGYDVLPVRFGTVTKRAEAITKNLLQDRAEELLNTFPLIEGKVELGLRAIWSDMPRVFQEIIAENTTIQQAKERAKKSPDRFRIAAVGEMVKRALDTKREQEAQRIITSLKGLATDVKERDLLGDMMILSYAFLVSKENGTAFDQRMQQLERGGQQRGIKFKYFGPIPPFNFVELHLQV